MDVTTERQDDVLSAQVGGRIDGSNTAEFEEAIRTAIEENDRAVIMASEKLVYISSAGLRAILLTAKSLGEGCRTLPFRIRKSFQPRCSTQWSLVQPCAPASRAGGRPRCRSALRGAACSGAAMLMLAACGGGGGGDHGPVVTMPTDPTLSDLGRPGGEYAPAGPVSPRHAKHTPIYRAGDFLMTGVDQRLDPKSFQQSSGLGINDFDIRYGRRRDGVPEATIEAYLRDAFPNGVERFVTTPEVRVIGDAQGWEIERLNAAVQLVNTALPEPAKMRIGSPMPGFSLQDTIRNGRRFRDGRELRGIIHVEFVDENNYQRDSGAVTWNSADEVTGIIESPYTQMNRGAIANTRERERWGAILLAHELIHALGLGHVSPSFDTIMEATSDIYATSQGTPQPLSLLYPVDREALRATYEDLAPGVTTDFLLLSYWEDTKHISGTARHAAFGVALGYDDAEPWAYGLSPNMALSDNPSLRGSVTWNGALVGFTVERFNERAVTGDARISVDLGTLTGHADFTELESWNLTPGRLSLGTWLDGDLGYTIAVRGNQFHETGGDVGRLTGIFVGRNHEGATGTLVRDDLTAAFGAER